MANSGQCGGQILTFMRRKWPFCLNFEHHIVNVRLLKVMNTRFGGIKAGIGAQPNLRYHVDVSSDINMITVDISIDMYTISKVWLGDGHTTTFAFALLAKSPYIFQPVFAKKNPAGLTNRFLPTPTQQRHGTATYNLSSPSSLNMFLFFCTN